MAEVLVASQLRSGRANANPKSFFGRGYSILLFDAIGFLLGFLGTDALLGAIGAVDPAIAGSAATVILPILPTFAIGVVLVAGVMFELTTTSKFAGSDAVNWLPLVPSEYVLASSLAVGYSYSFPLAGALGVATAVALVSGQYLPFALAAFFGLLGVVEAGFLIEMVRAATQRVSAVVVGRTGRMTIALRAAVIVVLLLLFQFAFNPVLLYDALGPSGPGISLTTLVPLLWTSRAVYAVLAQQYLVAGGFAAGALVLFAALGFLAFDVRERYWVPLPTEIRLAAHTYGETHPYLARLGFGPVEASILTKDLHGLLRRKEMLPLLALPPVLGLFGIFSMAGTGPAGFGPGPILWAGMIAGFFALFLSTTSIGQERRGLVNLYVNPVPPRSVFRAKAGLVVLLAGAFGLVISIGLSAWYRFPIGSALGTALLSLLTVLEGTFVGLSFATQYSDFQERPRPQYLRPAAMLAAMLVGMTLLFLTAGPIAFGLAGGVILPASFVLPLLLFGAAVALCVIPLTFWWARRGIEQMMRELPF